MRSFVICALAIGVLALVAGLWLSWQLLRQNGRILLRLEELEKRLNELEFGEGEAPTGLPVGSEAPAFELPDLTGETRALAQYRGQPVLLIFFNPACGFCQQLAPKLKQVAENGGRKPEGIGGASLGARPALLVVTTGGAEANRTLLSEPEFACPVLLQNEMEVATAYKAPGTPSGYLVDTGGRIASELAVGADALLALMDAKTEMGKQNTETALNRPDNARTSNGNGDGRADRFRSRSLARSKIKRDGLKAGTPAPGFRLPRLDGRGELTLSELRGRRVLLVFSSPTCGPCISLVPQLQKFHRDHPGLEVVMVSKGEQKENRAKVKEHGLTFPVVLQQQWEVSRLYAIFATPVAYLIDQTGVIIHDVAVGTDAILELMRRAEALSHEVGGNGAASWIS